MALPTIQPIAQYFDLSGLPLESGYIYIGTANTDPETNPITVYYDAAGTIPATQPIRTIAGYPAKNGSPAMLFVSEPSYSIRWRNSSGTLIKYLPEVPTPLVSASEFGATLVAAADAAAAREILELEIGVDVQAYSAEIATVAATEAEMRAGISTDLKSMSPELVAFAIDEQGTFVRVTVDDTTPGYLEDKLDAGNGISLDVVNPGANETLSISIDGGYITRTDSEDATGETSISWTGLPADVNGIDVDFRVLGNLNVNTYIQLGTSLGYDTTNYFSSRTDLIGGADFVQFTSSNTGFVLGGGGAASGNYSGVIHIRRISGNQWTCSGSAGTDSGDTMIVAGRIALSDELTRIRLNANSAFSIGTASIQYW